ncbi:hypothetical protein CK203_070148 [Vitis vinifera]|uniref:Uncharacterized protein n=1 Tax=Vitis vinifera TaxID=29760 RepID=A0A438EHR8_VITVI|nr:hypothetical protein CK203_070148 [Vitis vinifera]
MGFKVGKCSKIRFWTDLWCGNSVLSHDFPNLFSMAAHRNVTVEECWDQNTGQGGWILGLLRDLNDWEVGLVGNILAVLRDYSVTMEDDAVCWKKGEDGLFKIKYAYNVLANSHGLDFPHSNVWVGKVQPKLPFLLGKLLGGKSSRWIGCKEEGGIYLIDVFCAGYVAWVWVLSDMVYVQVREAQLAQYNYILVVGEEEANTGQFDNHPNPPIPNPTPIDEVCLVANAAGNSSFPVSPYEVSVRVRDKGDHSVMSMENLLSYFKSEIAAFH